MPHPGARTGAGTVSPGEKIWMKKKRLSTERKKERHEKTEYGKQKRQWIAKRYHCLLN